MLTLSQQPARLFEDLHAQVLVAACDMLVLRALELIGKRIVRDERSRFQTLQTSGRAWFEAYTIWTPEPAQVDAALATAWSNCDRIIAFYGHWGYTESTLKTVLDEYVRHLVQFQQPHNRMTLTLALQP
jgi:hypothetical protein